MAERRVLALITLVIAILTLVAAPAAKARRRHLHFRAYAQARRCRNDKQCKGGTCNGAGQCCSNFAGELACGTGCCNVLLGGACCGANECVDITHDHDNCGGCGIVCSGDETCQSGSCQCPSIYPTECNGRCVNTTQDPYNCGACGHECASRSCTNGTCDCPAGQTDCNGACVDTQTDRNNCGGCGNACAADKDCVGGSCQNLCPPCEVFQNGACVPRDCGPCSTCDGATDQCTSTCGGGQICCGNICVNSPHPPGGTCCEWEGDPFACASGEQCAGAFGCCSGGTQVCLGADGHAQCCYGGNVCGPTGLCCDPRPYPDCYGNGCCYNQ